MARDCTKITFRKRCKVKRGKKTCHKLARPVHVTRCKGRKLRAHNRRQCRAGGPGWKAKVKANFRKGQKGARALAPARFVACR